MLLQDVCPSVCHMPVFCQQRWTYTQFFYHQLHHSSFSVSNTKAVFRWGRPNEGVEWTGVWKSRLSTNIPPLEIVHSHRFGNFQFSSLLRLCRNSCDLCLISWTWKSCPSWSWLKTPGDATETGRVWPSCWSTSIVALSQWLKVVTRWVCAGTW